MSDNALKLVIQALGFLCHQQSCESAGAPLLHIEYQKPQPPGGSEGISTHHVPGARKGMALIKSEATIPPAGWIWRSYYYAGGVRVAVRSSATHSWATHGLDR